MKKETIKWRLSKLPTPEELSLLVDKKILTTEEAKEILLSSEELKEVSELEEEIKFLRKLVEKLSQNNTQIITTIKEIEVPVYIRKDWYRPYEIWCTGNLIGKGTVSYSCSEDMALNSVTNCSFSAIS